MGAYIYPQQSFYKETMFIGLMVGFRGCPKPPPNDNFSCHCCSIESEGQNVLFDAGLGICLLPTVFLLTASRIEAGQKQSVIILPISYCCLNRFWDYNQYQSIFRLLFAIKFDLINSKRYAKFVLLHFPVSEFII